MARYWTRARWCRLVRIIDVCLANDRAMWAEIWKAGLPLEALRSLAMQASIGKTPSGGGTFARSHGQVAECCLSNHFRRLSAPSASEPAPGLNRARVSLTSKAFCRQCVKAVSAHYMATVPAAAGGRVARLARTACWLMPSERTRNRSNTTALRSGRSNKRPPPSGFWGGALALPVSVTSRPHGALYGNRTRDSQILSLVLFQLS